MQASTMTIFGIIAASLDVGIVCFLYHLGAFPWLRGGEKKALGTRLRLHPDFTHAFRNWVSYVFVQGQPPVVRRCPYAQVVLPTGKRSHFFQRTPAG